MQQKIPMINYPLASVANCLKKASVSAALLFLFGSSAQILSQTDSPHVAIKTAIWSKVSISGRWKSQHLM